MRTQLTHRRLTAITLLTVSLALGLGAEAEASSLSFAIDIGIVESIDETIETGVYRGAGRLAFDESLVAESSFAVVSWSQISAFSLDLSPFALDLESLRSGSCITAQRLPLCGLLFVNGELQGIVGQYSIPSPIYALRLDNTSPSLFDAGLDFQSTSIESLDLGFVVAGGFVSARPIPEPSSVAAFAIGAAIVGFSLRRRVRRA